MFGSKLWPLKISYAEALVFSAVMHLNQTQSDLIPQRVMSFTINRKEARERKGLE